MSYLVEREPTNFGSYQKLGYAICEHACQEYKFFLKQKKKLMNKRFLTDSEFKKYKRCKKEIYDCEQFFLGEWFKFLTMDLDLDGQTVINNLKKKVYEELNFSKKDKDSEFLNTEIYDEDELEDDELELNE